MAAVKGDKNVNVVSLQDLDSEREAVVTKEKIYEMKTELSQLSFFKIKQKKSLQEQIDDLSKKVDILIRKAVEEKEALKSENVKKVLELENKKASIEKEINKIKPQYDRVIEMVKAAMV